jgi:type IV pilus assembly protein PilQ
LRLEITPHVIDGKNLKMTILVKKDEVDTTRKDSLGDPYIIKKQTETVLIVQDGETIVISGLTKQTKGASGNGVPWLKDLPVIGWAFKSDSKSDKMEEVLIFITPHILPVGDSQIVSGAGKM